MYEAYLNIVTHPLTWVFLIGTLVFFLIQAVIGSKRKIVESPDTQWLRRNYVWVIIGVASLLLASAVGFYLLEVGYSLWALVDLLREATLGVKQNGLIPAEQGEVDLAFDDDVNKNGSSADLRNLAYAVAVLLGVMAAATTIFFSLIRVWINERQTSATEQGLITDRINKAVEALGAEKEVNRLGRTFVYWEGKTPHKTFEWQDEPLDLPDGARMDAEHSSDWQNIGLTEPNLEVRIGGLLALERLMKDSLQDHIQIMEILTAYLRQNAGGVVPKDMPATDAGREAWETWRWRNKPKELRLDVDTCLRVIERRRDAGKAFEKRGKYKPILEHAPLAGLNLSQRNLEAASLQNAELQGAKLWGAKLQGADLRSAKLRGADLGYAELQGANLRSAQLQGANLWDAKLQGANLWGAQLQGADLTDAKLQGADLTDAKLQGANLWGAQLQGANLWDAKLQGADLWGARFDADTDLSSATLRGALLRSVDFTSVPQIAPHVAEIFGVGEIGLPEGVECPSHWIDEPDTGVWKENERIIRQAWRDWVISQGWDDVPLPEVEE